MKNSITLSIISLLGIIISITHAIEIANIRDGIPGITIEGSVTDGSSIIYTPGEGERIISIDKKIIGGEIIGITISIDKYGIPIERYIIKRNGIWNDVEKEEYIATIHDGHNGCQNGSGGVIPEGIHRAIDGIGGNIRAIPGHKNDHNGPSMDIHSDIISEEIHSGIDEVIDSIADDIGTIQEDIDIVADGIAQTIAPAKGISAVRTDIPSGKGDIPSIKIDTPSIKTGISSGTIIPSSVERTGRPIFCSIKLDIRSIRPAHTTIHEGHLGGIIQRTFIPNSECFFTKVVEGNEIIWEASDGIGASSAYIYIKGDSAELLNIFIKGGNSAYFVKYDGSWIKTSKREYDARYSKIQNGPSDGIDVPVDHHPDPVDAHYAPIIRDIIIDILDLQERDICIKHPEKNITIIEPKEGSIIRSIKEGEIIIWSSKEFKCISASIIFKEDIPVNAEISICEGGRIKIIHFGKDDGIWKRIGKETYEAKIKEYGIGRRGEDGFLTNSLLLIPFLLTIVSLYGWAG